MPGWLSGVRGQQGQAGWRPQKGNRNLNNYWLQFKVRRICECTTLKATHTSGEKKKKNKMWNWWKMDKRDEETLWEWCLSVEACSSHFLPKPTAVRQNRACKEKKKRKKAKKSQWQKNLIIWPLFSLSRSHDAQTWTVSRSPPLACRQSWSQS